MLLTLNPTELAGLLAFCERDEDCEQISESELVLDLYGISAPMSLDLVLEAGGARVDGAFFLGFDEALDGYYLAEPVKDPRAVLQALVEAGAIPQ